jgi:hypothetical protein
MRRFIFHSVPFFQEDLIKGMQRQLVAMRSIAFVLLAPLFAMVIAPTADAQQAAPVERVYKHPSVEVERALRDLGAYAAASLPALDGFVNADSNTFDFYENPHYEFRVKLTAQAAEQTLVSVSARVTAWYPNALPSESRYVLLPSNGRLEKELLDHLTVYLEKGTVRPPSGSTPTATASKSFAPTSAPPSSAANAAVRPANPIAPMGDFSHADPATLPAQIAKVQAERQSIEEEEKKLQQQISQLEADRNARRYLSDLAMVKTAQAAVFQENNEFSKVLFRADPEDEFTVTEARFGWVRVRLDNLGQGWIRINDLQLPNEKDDTGDSADFAEPNEEVAPFTGNWALLKDKPTLFVVAQPKHAIPTGSLGQSQIEFAKHAFLDGYRAAAHSQEKIDGVAVVFLGDKAGMAAATLTEINRWHKGAISDKLFLERCFLSPPEAFRDIPNR